MKTKNEIVDKLYKAGHITLEEVLVLCEESKELLILRERLKDSYTPLPFNNPIQPMYPFPNYPSIHPYTIINSTNPKMGENSCLRSEDLTGKI